MIFAFYSEVPEEMIVGGKLFIHGSSKGLSDDEPEHAKNVPQSKVVVFLLGQLLLAQCIQNIELPREVGEPLVAHRAQLDLHDDLSIWHHHCDRSEQDLKFVCTPCKTSYDEH